MKDFINLIAIIIVIPLLRLYLHFFGLGALHGGFIRYVASLFSEYKTKNLLNQPAFVPISTMKRNNVQLFPFVNCRKFSSFTSSCLRLGTGEPRIKQNSDADPDVNSYLSWLDSLNPDFLNWFVGFTDAEGNFLINSNIKNGRVEKFNFRFTIRLHKDDLKVLQYIREVLQIGKVYNHDLVYFLVTRQEEIKKLIMIFDKYPLNSIKQLNYLSACARHLEVSVSTVYKYVNNNNPLKIKKEVPHKIYYIEKSE